MPCKALLFLVLAVMPDFAFESSHGKMTSQAGSVEITGKDHWTANGSFRDGKLHLYWKWKGQYVAAGIYEKDDNDNFFGEWNYLDRPKATYLDYIRKGK